MTKKEQALDELDAFVKSCINVPLSGPLQLHPRLHETLEKIITIVHAIDEAEREERGVVDMQEITKCEHCEFFNEEWQMCDHDNGPKERHMIGNRIPSWCPRRKENRKS